MGASVSERKGVIAEDGRAVVANQMRPADVDEYWARLVHALAAAKADAVAAAALLTKD